jgi:RNA polymerase sigma-70 factor, ECF subfamily
MDPTARDASEWPLLEGAQRGDLDAFSELMRRHQAGVRVYLGAHLRDAHVLDDLVQDVFLRAFRSLPTLQDPAAFRSWLTGIAHHRVLEHLRERSRRATREREIFEAFFDHSQIALLEGEDHDARKGIELEALRHCLRRLPPEGARLVREHYFKGRKIAAFAEEEGKNESAIRMSLFRLREALRDCMRRRMTGGRA